MGAEEEAVIHTSHPTVSVFTKDTDTATSTLQEKVFHSVCGQAAIELTFLHTHGGLEDNTVLWNNPEDTDMTLGNIEMLSRGAITKEGVLQYANRLSTARQFQLGIPSGSKTQIGHEFGGSDDTNEPLFAKLTKEQVDQIVTEMEYREDQYWNELEDPKQAVDALAEGLGDVRMEDAENA
jgi:hypothetical protein